MTHINAVKKKAVVMATSGEIHVYFTKLSGRRTLSISDTRDATVVGLKPNRYPEQNRGGSMKLRSHRAQQRTFKPSLPMKRLCKGAFPYRYVLRVQRTERAVKVKPVELCGVGTLVW